MTRVLFADILQPKLDIAKSQGSGTYWEELQDLVDRHSACPQDWVVQLNTDEIRRERKYDKFEPAITYYLWTALGLASDRLRTSSVLSELFGKTFRDADVLRGIVHSLTTHGWDDVQFEALLTPDADLRKTVQSHIDDHPIPYIREIGTKKSGVRFEAATHLDLFIGANGPLIEGGGEWALGSEAKFTSDIDCQTTYSSHRNQIIRNIEVGNSRFKSFTFLLVTPRKYRERYSRFFVYKMEEYLGEDGAKALQRDALGDVSDNEAAEWQQRIGWLNWEDFVDVIFPNGQAAFDHKDAPALAQFLKDRRLMPQEPE